MNGEQPLDYPLVGQHNDGRANQSIIIDTGKHAAVIAVCAVVCGLSGAVALWAGYQAQVMTTEYRVELNHRMEMEARQKVMAEEIQEIKHGHR